jgi:Spy/CpxP family protein refolding chaperone
MKRIITSALVLALTIGAAQAQTTSTQDNGKHARKEHKMHAMKQLNLTPDQKAKMKTLHEEQRKEMEALKNDKTATREQKEQLHKKYEEQMQAILTPDQRQQLEKMKEERMAKGKQGAFEKEKGPKEGFKRGADLQKELGLSQDQQAKMEKIRADYKSQLETLRNDNSLSKDEKRTKMHELMKKQQEEMKTVLTREQIEKMKTLRKERSSRNAK